MSDRSNVRLPGLSRFYSVKWKLLLSQMLCLCQVTFKQIKAQEKLDGVLHPCTHSHFLHMLKMKVNQTEINKFTSGK